MLSEIRIKNYILIEDIHLKFNKGLSVITGETGAGKSILLEGIRIALGQSVSKDDLKDKNEKAIFEIIIELENDLYAITRELFSSGRTISRINGDIVRIEDVKNIALKYISVQAQRDDSLMFHKSFQEELIDKYIDKSNYILFDELEEIVKLQKILIDDKEKLVNISSSDISIIEDRYNELMALSVDLEKDSLIEKRFSVLINLRDIIDKFESSKDIISGDGGLLDKLYLLIRNLDSIDTDYSKSVNERIESVIYEIDDISRSINSQIVDLDIDEQEINYIRERFEALHYIKKKYQLDLEGILILTNDYKNKIDFIKDAEKNINNLNKKIRENIINYNNISLKIKKLRAEAFIELKNKLDNTLREISMPGFYLDIIQNERINKMSKKGAYSFEIVVGINKDNLKPIRTTLSGGERSRFMLAILSVFSKHDNIPILIFDEIDTGISGKAAFDVGNLLYKLSKQKQIIAITHLPQLVSFCDYHYIINKSDNITKISLIKKEEHPNRLAEMMTSDINDMSVKAAKNMIKRAKGEI